MGLTSPVKVSDRFQFERKLIAKGARRIAGVDEAGRGPLAGPVVVAAVCLPISWVDQGLLDGLLGLNDSKKLSERRRNEYFEFLTHSFDLDASVVAIEPEEIDAINILRATHEGMCRALDGLAERPDHVLVDGLRVSRIELPQTALVKGDSLSYSIAAASVLAKVTRDRRMMTYASEFPGYGFERHKGYPTPAHLQALSTLGPCAIHRKSFAPVRAQQLDLL